MPPASSPEGGPEFGVLLKRLRRQAGLSQEALAERSELSPQAISALESGARRAPRRDTVERLAAALRLAPAARASLEAAAAAQRHRASPDAPSPQERLAPQAPAPPTSLIGRAREAEAICSLLRGAERRLVTLIGPGGVGKTRLALQVAADLRPTFPDAVWFVPLAGLSDPDLVLARAAQALGVRDIAGQPILESLGATLNDRRALLVLDNFEHLLPAALAVAELLAACPDLRVLVTSRTVLNVTAEQRFVLAPLALPAAQPETLAALAQADAVRLFVARAQAARPDFALTDENGPAVAEICRRVGGLPLAIELAAAQVRTLPPARLTERLEQCLPLLSGGHRDLPPRQQTLRATLDWSYELLPPAVQLLFRRACVFAGGWTLDAAEAVCAHDGIEPAQVLDLLAELIDASLITMEERDGAERYQVLEPLRQYGQERLRAADEDATLRERHCRWCASLAEEAEPMLAGPEQRQWLRRLAEEHDNMRAALRWSVATWEEGALRLAGALSRFWEIHGSLGEGRRWLESALAGAGNAVPGRRAKALHGAGRLAARQGDYERAEAHHEESLALCRAVGERAGCAAALVGLGTVARYRGDSERAEALLEEGLALYRELGDVWGEAGALNGLGEVPRSRGELQRASVLLGESLARYRALGDRRGIAAALCNLGWIARSQGDYAGARALHEESLALRRELGDKLGIANSLDCLGEAARHLGDYDAARALHEEALTLQRALGDRRGATWSLNSLAWLAYEEGDDDRAASLFELTLHRWRELGDGWAIAAACCSLGRALTRCGQHVRALALLQESLVRFRDLADQGSVAYVLEACAALALAKGPSPSDTRQAAQLFGAAEAFREAANAPMPPYDRPEYERDVALLRRRMDADALAAAWAEGRGTPIGQAIGRVQTLALPTLSGAASRFAPPVSDPPGLPLARR